MTAVPQRAEILSTEELEAIRAAYDDSFVISYRDFMAVFASHFAVSKALRESEQKRKATLDYFDSAFGLQMGTLLRMAEEHADYKQRARKAEEELREAEARIDRLRNTYCDITESLEHGIERRIAAKG